MANQVKSIRSSRSAARRAARSNRSFGNTVLRAVVLAFAGGVGLCLLILALLALLLANTALPLTLVRPFACIASAAGSAFSGFLLARKLARQYLLCGLGTGVFYAFCQVIAVFATSGTFFQQGSDLMLPVALLLGGLLGGTLAALRAVH